MRRALLNLFIFTLHLSPLYSLYLDAPPPEYLEAVAPLESRMTKMESEHFVFWAERRDMILGTYALEALEKAYDNIGKTLESFPAEKITVQVYRTQEDFTVGSTLSKETLDR